MCVVYCLRTGVDSFTGSYTSVVSGAWSTAVVVLLLESIHLESDQTVGLASWLKAQSWLIGTLVITQVLR